ncbi:branched-chain amino acid ABC transporter permease [Halobacteriales archaeon QS_1_68_20]|nr:MAG: branched-chain amino acid ABC transporter permease [Halobacteriales archaeon QS_1_68_20]
MVGFEALVRATILGLQFGTTLALLVAGLTLVFGLMDVINLAHGSLYMLGAYFGVTLVDAGGSFWLALVVAPVAVGVVGLLMEVFTLRPLYGREPLYQILVTLGLAFVVEESVKEVWGTSAQNFAAPAVLAGSIDIAGVTYSQYQAFVLLFTTVLVAAIWVGLERTNVGVLLQATAHDPEMVDALGFDVSRVFTGVFAVSAVLAGLAGVLLGPARAVTPSMWFNVVLLAFAIIVIGGLGNFRGAIVASLLVGLLTGYAALLVPSYTELLVFALMAVVLLVRPAGIFGTATGDPG